MKSLLLTAILGVVFSIAGAQTSQRLPDLILKDLNGKNVNVSDYGKSSKNYIISFWATWCSPCKKELKNLNEVIEEWREKYNVEVVAVSIDNSRNVLKVKPYVDGLGWDFEVLLDINEELKRAMNAPNVPYTVLVNASGDIVYQHSGYIEGDEHHLEEEFVKLMPKK